MKVSTSILSASDIGKCLSELDKTKTDFIHLDIMDGKFVFNETWHLEDLMPYLENVGKPLDIHLMVEDIINYVNEFSFLNPEFITFHLEATDNVKSTVEYIKKMGIKAGIAISPNTDIEKLYPYLKNVDLVLVMSVEPGAGGQSFMKESTDRINKLKEYKVKNNLKYIINVDGGINDKTIGLVTNADMVVAGSFIISGPYDERISILKDYSND